MANLDERIFGYHSCKVDPKDNGKLLNSLLKLGICADVRADGKFSLRKRDAERFISHAGNRLHFEISRPLGLYGFILRARHRYGVFLALFIAVVIYVFSFGRVWDVRVSGNVKLSDFAVEEALSESGLSVGSRWKKVDKNVVENELLKSNPGIAWISVNRRGAVAYVEVIESENLGRQEDAGYPFSNIVADRDGVIEEITVESGSAVVKAGDVVRKGDILISGVIENENGVTFCRAQGSVRAKNVATVTAEAMGETTAKTPKSKRLTEYRIVIFDFSINIFKNYRNCGNSCDIIKENRKIALFSKYRLPIRIEKVHAVTYEETSYTRSPEEMASYAKRELDGKIYSMFKDADVLKLRTEGELRDGVYLMTARVVYSTDIGRERAIEIH